MRRITGKDPSSASIHWPCGGEYHDWLWREFTLKTYRCLPLLRPTNLDKSSRSVQTRLYEIAKNEVWILPIARFFLILLGPNQSLRLHEVLSAQLYGISPQHPFLSLSVYYIYIAICQDCRRQQREPVNILYLIGFPRETHWVDLNATRFECACTLRIQPHYDSMIGGSITSSPWHWPYKTAQNGDYMRWLDLRGW